MDRLPPQEIECEESILAGCLCVPGMASDVSDELKQEHFYSTTNGLIFGAILSLSEAGEPADMPAIISKLREDGDLERVGGASRISELLSLPIPSSSGFYCKKIKNAWTLRKAIEISNQITQSCFEGGEAEKIIDKAQRQIMSINTDTEATTESFSDLCESSIDRYEAIYKNRGQLSGITSGFSMLDHYTCGWQDSNLIILAARPSMGKSALIGSFCLSAANDGAHIGGFSLEMAKSEWIDRSVASLARINSTKFRSGYFNSEDWERINSAMGRLSRLQIHIDDTGGLHHSEIRRRARAMKKKFGCRMFFIDHLQLVHGDNQHNRTSEVSSITASMKEMAKELNSPVILLSQLNRKVEERGNKRPVLSDLRDSGTIEQDADIVMFLYRRAVYNDWLNFKFGDQKFDKHPGYDISNEMRMAFDGDSEIIIAKQRNGPIGTVKAFWESKYTTFRDITTKEQS